MAVVITRAYPFSVLMNMVCRAPQLILLEWATQVSDIQLRTLCHRGQPVSCQLLTFDWPHTCPGGLDEKGLRLCMLLDCI